MTRPNVAPPAAGKKPKSDHALVTELLLRKDVEPADRVNLKAYFDAIDLYHRSLRRTEHDDLVRLAKKHGLYVPAPARSAAGEGFYSTRQTAGSEFAAKLLAQPIPVRPDRRSA